MDEIIKFNAELKEKQLGTLEGNVEHSVKIFRVFEDSEMVIDLQARVILHWNYRNLKEIPEEVFKYGSHLKELYLKRNSIVNLSPQISQLKNLTNLYLIGNQLELLPKEIGQLRSLKVLDLSQNNLEELPLSITELEELRQLILTHNQIKALPPDFSRLKKLEYLEVSGNHLYRLPDDMFNLNGLESLRELALDQNPIQYLPRNLCRHERLRCISICHGNLKFIPAIPPSSFVCRESEDDNLQFRIDGNPFLNYLPVWMHQIFGHDLECFGCDVDRKEKPDNVTGECTIIKYCPPETSIKVSNLEVNFNGKPRTLHFDEDLCEISHLSERKPCSLFESCLRFIYKHQGIAQEDKDVASSHNKIFSTSNVGKIIFTQDDCSFLPSNLTRLLTIGPVSQCFQCLSPIFTQTWVLIFSFHNQNVNNPNPDMNVDNHHHHILGPRLPGNRMPLSVIHFCSSNCIQRMYSMQSHGSSYCYPGRNAILENIVHWSPNSP